VPEPTIADEDLELLTKAYLIHRTSRPLSQNFNDDSTRYAHPGGRVKRLIGALGLVAIVSLSVVAAAVVLTFHIAERGATSAAPPRAVKIVRTPGTLVLAPIARNVDSTVLAQRLAHDVENLPPMPSGCHARGGFGGRVDGRDVARSCPSPNSARTCG